MENEGSATTPRSQDTPESPNAMSETIPSNSNSLDMEGEDDTDSSCQNTTQITGNANQGCGKASQEEEVSAPSLCQVDNAREAEDGGDMEREDCGEVISLDDKQNEAEVELPLTSQHNSPNPHAETDGTDMESEECGVKCKNTLHSPDMTQDKEKTVALTSQPNSPSSCTERDSTDMESEDCGGIAVNTQDVTQDEKNLLPRSSRPDVPNLHTERDSTDMESEDCGGVAGNTQDMTQGEKTLIPTSSQPNIPDLHTERDSTDMESEDCGGVPVNTQDVTQGEKTLLPTSGQPNVPNLCTGRDGMDMESEDWGIARKNSPDMAQGENTILPSSSQPNSPISCTERGSTVMESEDCGVASKNSPDVTQGEKTHLPLPSQLNSENSLNIESEGCDVTEATEHSTTSNPVEATLPLSNQSSSHDNINMEGEDYAVTETSKESTASSSTETTLLSATQSRINIDSPSTASRDCALVTQTDQNVTSEAAIPALNQDKGKEEAMIPRDAPLHPLPLTPLPTNPTILESKSCHQEGGENNKETRNERKVRRGIKRKTPSASKGIQTSIHLLDSNSVFRDRVVDLPMLKREAGVVCVEDLHDLDVAFEEWPILLVSQLKLRDTIIESLNSVIRELAGHGQVLEQDLDYLKLKILELQQEAKKRAKEDQQKSHKTQAKEAESQTTEEDLTEAWSRWYYGCWGDYYSECDPTSSSYWPGHYTQQSTVPSRTTGTMEEETQQKTAEEEHEGTVEKLQAVNCEKEEKERKNEDSSHCNAKSDDTRHSEKRKKLKGKRKKERHKSEKSSKELTSTEREQEMDTEKSTRRRKKAEKKRQDRREESEDNTQTTAPAASTRLPQEDVTSNKSTKEMNGKEEAEEEEGNEKSHGWDVSESITQQVAAVAAQAVVESGYVFQEELGLYYDYNTGYYYNAENGLYYDTKSGTYFYYDHNTQSYQFHSQVSPSDTTDTKRRKKKADKKGKSKSSSRNEDSREKEEGECTESDHEQEDAEESDSEEEREEEDMTSPDRHDEEGAAAADVPPSLRLMVVEGGERVRMGELHVVTLNGGTVGRESTNAVHLPDLNISKVHAEIEYRSTGPEDHRYFIRDLGSNNGTFVNNVRLSEARQTSSEVEVGHGWEVQFGPVKVKCHLHPGTLTCNECEPGLVLQNLPSQPGEGVASFKNAKCKEKARRKALKAMQKKYKLTHREAQAAASTVAPGYTDRTLLRQAQKGSDNPYEKTEVASSEVPLRETNRGFTLLQKMGWSKGQGLGKDNTGRKEPVQQVSVVGKAGLGSSHPSALLPPDPWAERRKKQLQLTQERYSQQ